MVTAKKTTAQKKSIDDQIAATEKKLAFLKAKKTQLNADSPGMKELLSAVDSVVKQNSCKAKVVVETLARIKKTGLVLTQKPRKQRDPSKVAAKKTAAKSTASKK
jgi:hypothetical protein